MKKRIYSFIIFLNSISLFSQQNKIDSLLFLLRTAKNDTSKVEILNNLSTLYRDVSIEHSKKYAYDAVRLASNLLYDKGVADAYNKIGILYDDISIYDSAIQYFDSALTIYEKIQDKNGTAITTNNIGNCYKSKGAFEKAVKYYLTSLKIRETNSDQKGMAESYNSIANVYVRQDNYSQALPFYWKSLSTATKINYEKIIATAYVNLGKLYRETNQLDSGLYYMNKAYSLSLKIGNKRVAAYTLINLATVYTDLKNYETAKKNYLEALDLLQPLDDKSAIVYCLGGIGEIYSIKGDFSLALKYQDSCRRIAVELGEKDLLKQTYLSLSETYANKGDYLSAYKFHSEYSKLKDSLLNEESSKQIAEMQTKYETEKKEQQITLLNKDKELQDAQLNRQKIIIWSVAGGLLVVLILSIFIFRERRKSEKLLLNILPVETARELKQNGKATARHYESVTVMFTDFKGFTTIAEKLSAEELVSELDFLFKKFDEIISKYPIEKIKTIGDAYMCAGGLPTANITHAMDVVSAAIEIQSWMAELKTNDSRLNTWELRIGIHTGAVTAGVVGDKKFAYDIWGDTVNTASRMESSGEAGKINISGATHELINDKLMANDSGLKTVFRGKIPAKNKGEIDMYFVDKI